MGDAGLKAIGDGLEGIVGVAHSVDSDRGGQGEVGQTVSGMSPRCSFILGSCFWGKLAEFQTKPRVITGNH